MGQFYLAWVGLVPWLIWLAESRSRKSAFFWSWIAGTLFFIGQYVVDGDHQLAGDAGADDRSAGFFGALAALIIRGAGFLHGGIPQRGVWGLPSSGRRRNGCGASSLPDCRGCFWDIRKRRILPMCQIADIDGGVWCDLLGDGGQRAGGDGVDQSRSAAHCPSRRGGCGDDDDHLAGIWTVSHRADRTISFTRPDHRGGPDRTILRATAARKAPKIGTDSISISGRRLAALNKSPGKIDMVVWSETMMEGLNATARVEDSDVCRMSTTS